MHVAPWGLLGVLPAQRKELLSSPGLPRAEGRSWPLSL